MPGKRNWEEVIGEKFGRLTILELAGMDSARKMKVRCLCSCGGLKELRYNSLQGGRALSCGCYIREVTAARNTIHGLSYHPDFQVWVDMNKRCHGSNPDFTKNYRDRGITVCAQWRSDPAQFLRDMGPRPKGLSLERVDNSKGYSPENCVWASMKTQQNNKRTNVLLDFQGKCMNITQWAEHLGIPKQTLIGRLRYGWSVEDVLTRPIDERCRHPRRRNSEIFKVKEAA